MNKYSIWYLPYNKRYLITHPWKWFRCAWRNLCDAWRRSVYGFTWSDVWDWDHWFTRVVPDMLRHMANHGSAYPGHAPFETPEKWHDWLQYIAHLIETADEEWQDEHNEYHEAYMKEILKDWKPWVEDENGMLHHTPSKPSDLHEKYMARARELSEEGEKNIALALKEIGEHFYSIWD